MGLVTVAGLVTAAGLALTSQRERLDPG